MARFFICVLLFSKREDREGGRADTGGGALRGVTATSFARENVEAVNAIGIGFHGHREQLEYGCEFRPVGRIAADAARLQ